MSADRCSEASPLESSGVAGAGWGASVRCTVSRAASTWSAVTTSASDGRVSITCDRTARESSADAIRVTASRSALYPRLVSSLTIRAGPSSGTRLAFVSAVKSVANPRARTVTPQRYGIRSTVRSRAPTPGPGIRSGVAGRDRCQHPAAPFAGWLQRRSAVPHTAAGTPRTTSASIEQKVDCRPRQSTGR